MKKIFCSLLGFVVLFSACNPGDFGDTNIDPNTVSTVPTKALLTNVFNNSSNSATSTNFSLASTVFGDNSANFYVQHLSEGPYPGSSLYTVRNFNWSGYYTGPLSNLQTIIDKNNSGDPTANPGVNGSKDNQIAVARILKAYFFWWLTDRYGDIPYSEALKGNDNLSPKYDTQKDIYYSLFTELKEAAAQIKVAEQGVSGDILLHGDMDHWKKFANTTRMMMALRLIKNDFAKGQAEFNEAIAAGVLESNADNVLYNYLDEPNNYNPWYFNYSVNFRNDYAISKTMTDYMGPKNDPRLMVYGENLAGTVKGLAYGSSAAKNIPGSYSRIGDKFRASDAPAAIFTYAQVLFAKAEGAKVGYLTGTDAQAAVYYADAIKASQEYHGVYSAANHAAYMAQVPYNAATGLQQIMTEKWVHMYLNGYETWSDWRRTGFPVLAPAPDGAQTTIPRRQGYPTNENAINGKSYQEAVARQGADNLNTKVWWDK